MPGLGGRELRRFTTSWPLHTSVVFYRKQAVVTPGDGVDMAVEDPGNLLAKSGDLMEVCGEKRDGLDLRGDVFRDGPSQSEAVVG